MALPPEAPSARLLDERITPATSGETLENADVDETLQTSSLAEVDDNSEAEIDSLATAYVIVTNSLAETLYKVLLPSDGDSDKRHLELCREEACVAAWTAIQVAIGASALSLFHRRSINHVLRERLPMYWQSRAKSSDWLDMRASSCLRGASAGPFVAAAARIIAILFESTGLSLRERESQVRALAGMVAHRIASDVHLLNEWESRQAERKARPSSRLHSV
jgi:hypothetical protein